MVKSLLITVVLVVAVAHSAIARPSRAGCTVRVNNDLGSPQPLVLNVDNTLTGHAAYHLPTNGDSITFDEGDFVRLLCPGGQLKVSGTNTGVPSDIATCANGKWSLNSKTVAFNQFTCTRLPYHVARYTGLVCEGGRRDSFKEVEVGFEDEQSNGRFLRTMRMCFDPVKQTTVYSEFNLTHNIGGYQSGFPRPSFIEDDFYELGGQKLDNLYSRNTQRTTVNNLLGLSATSNKYVQSSGDFFMSRGHLTAKADFVFGAQHSATFHFVNVAPQWQTFNGGNWNSMEMDSREFADGRESDLIVYTGTHGVTTLPHEQSGEDVELYLYKDNNNNKAIPVPQVYWRVLHDPERKAGIAFVGINNPYHTDVQGEIFCTDICSQVTWLKWDQKNIKKGYSYCCDVNELRKTITDIPDLSIDQLLL